MLQNVSYGKMSGVRKRESQNSRGQFKIQQMAFMLVAVVLFFVLVGLFWLAIQQRNLYKEVAQAEEEEAILMSEFLSSSSEFSCSRELGSYCIDADKLIVFTNRTVYRELWPVSFIRVRRVYPPEDKDIECNKANYPNCNLFNIYENKEIEYTGTGKGSFIALCRHEKNEGYAFRKCEIGKFIVGFELQYK